MCVGAGMLLYISNCFGKNNDKQRLMCGMKLWGNQTQLADIWAEQEGIGTAELVQAVEMGVCACPQRASTLPTHVQVITAKVLLRRTTQQQSHLVSGSVSIRPQSMGICDCNTV